MFLRRSYFPTLYRIPLTLSLEAGALIGGLRQAIDDMLTRMATNPALLCRHSPLDDEIIHAVESLVCLKATPANPPPPIHRSVYVITHCIYRTFGTLPCLPTQFNTIM